MQHNELPNPFSVILAKLASIENTIQDLAPNRERNENPNDLLTPEEAAKLLKVSSTSLWRMCKSGKIMQYGLAGKRYFKKEELLAALTELK